jgi:hypothetical protein
MGIKQYPAAHFFDAALSQDWAVWLETYADTEARIFALNLKTGELRPITAASNVVRGELSVNANRVAWLVWDNDREDHVMVYDLKSNVTREIEARHELMASLHISNDWLAYQVYYGDNHARVVLYNLSTKQMSQIPPLSVQGKIYQDVKGLTDAEVLYFEDSGGTDEGKVCRYSLVDGDVSCANNLPVILDSANDNFAVWESLVGDASQIFVYNLRTGAVWQVSHALHRASDAVINDKYLVWAEDQQLCYLAVDNFR